VPHIVELPDSDSDLRAELNIPPDATVFGRIGGGYSWNVHFVNQVISEILSVRSDVYFLLVNTPRISPYMDHERAKFFGPIVHDAALKRQFINTCDAMLHARAEGESFGIACGEFSICNRPVITYSESPERNHIEQLGRKALLYRDAQSLYTLLLGFKANRLLDWNCYKEFGTQRVMEEFKRVFIDAI
jgi:hypothetical protein